MAAWKTSRELWDALSPLEQAVIGPLPDATRTIGPAVCGWIERNCVLGEGDSYGQAVRLRAWQAAFIWRLYEVDELGRRVVATAVLGVAKGAGKTPLESWVAAVELAGPCVVESWAKDGTPKAGLRPSPSVVLLAKSWEQVALVFGEAETTFTTNAKLKALTETYRGHIKLKGKPGKLERVRAVRGTNDGKRPTALIVDEAHELVTESQAGALLVLHNGLAKRQDTFMLMGSTAGANMDTELGRLYQLGMRIRKGEAQPDPRFLFVWFEAAANLDPSDPADIRTGIRQANPLYDDEQVERTALSFVTKPLYEAMRYFWNRWTSAGGTWLSEDIWESNKISPEQWIDDPRLPTWIGADFARSKDTCAVVTVQQREDGTYQQRAKVWLPAARQIPHEEVMDFIVSEAESNNTQYVVIDPSFFAVGEQLEPRVSCDVVEIYPNSTAMSKAIDKTWNALFTGSLKHIGQPAFTDHVLAAITKEGSTGVKLHKNPAKPGRHIDAAVAMCLAMNYAYTPEQEPVDGFVF